jgi:HlyD family secretion protein
MSGSVDIITDIKDNILVVPIQAVTVRELDEESDKMDEVIFSMNADTAVMHIIKTGIQDDEYIQILSDLEVGKEIISGPYSVVARKLENGTAVAIKKEEDKDKKKE